MHMIIYEKHRLTAGHLIIKERKVRPNIQLFLLLLVKEVVMLSRRALTWGSIDRGSTN